MAESRSNTTTLVVGATGATGRHVVRQLLDQGHTVRAVVRSEQRMIDSLRAISGNKKEEFANLAVTEASFLDLSDDEVLKLVHGCDAVVSCLGHNMTFSGMYGKPRKLVTQAARKLCSAVVKDRTQEPGDEGTEMAPPKPGKFILMGSDGVANPDGGDDTRARSERAVLGMIRALVPPHRDNEAAAALVANEVGTKEESVLEWCVVRPTDLIDGEVSEYELFDKPKGSLFGGGEATRSNVAKCMVELILKDELWAEWKFKMPVLHNRTD
mmetsp:Transcript_2677/g.4797  ORF Transcript_2677/g.4797 Transcript_2677/m.4797 type:complete len:269 (-) Transcript_2677:111-917(-)